LGVILFLIKFLKPAFGTTHPNDRIYECIRRNDFYGFFSYHEAYGYDKNELKVIWECLVEQPQRRPTIHQLLSDPLAKSADDYISDDLVDEILYIIE